MNFKKDPRLLNSRTGFVEIEKDEKNLLGISIGGGSPNCPVLYLVNVFDNSPALRSELLEPGDEITSIDGCSCRGWAKGDLAKYIKSQPKKVRLGYSKLECMYEDGLTNDIKLKKLKHKLVENISSDTADNLGLSRAVLSNDQMAKKVEELENTRDMVKRMKFIMSQYVRHHHQLSRIYKGLSDVFSEISCHDDNNTAQKSSALVSEAHRCFSIEAQKLGDNLSTVIDNLHTFLTKVIPDAKESLKKYLNAKFEYLSFCLKVKEIEDEDADYLFDEDVSERLRSGNYDYRLYLKCRFLARRKFVMWKNNMLEKLELLDQKNVQKTVESLQKFAVSAAEFNNTCAKKASILEGFSIELSESFNNFPNN